MQHKCYNSYELETGRKFEFEGVERADLLILYDLFIVLYLM